MSVSIITNSTGTIVEVRAPNLGLVLVPDPQWAVAPVDVAALDHALRRWRAAATACGGECQHVQRLFADAHVPLRGACLDDDSNPAGLVDVMDSLVSAAAADLDDLATSIRVSRREWAEGLSKSITLAYGGGRTEAVVEITQHTHEWGGRPGGLAEVVTRTVYLRTTVAVRLREGLAPVGRDPDMWWSSLRASFEARAVAAGVLSTDRW